MLKRKNNAHFDLMPYFVFQWNIVGINAVQMSPAKIEKTLSYYLDPYFKNVSSSVSGSYCRHWILVATAVS